MHVGAEIVGNVERDDLAPRPLVEVVELSLGDVARVDVHVFVAIGPRVLVPEADSVADLVRYRAVLRTYSIKHIMRTCTCMYMMMYMYYMYVHDDVHVHTQLTCTCMFRLYSH